MLTICGYPPITAEMGSGGSRQKAFPFRPERAALLVIDMQGYFTRKGSHAYIPSSAAIIPRINRLIEAFQRAKRPVIFTRHIDSDKDNLMRRWWRDRIEEKDPLSRLSRKLKTGYGEIVIKDRYDAFMGTQLEETLRDAGVEQVAITGVATHLCCETTARSAFMRDFETFFVTDCTATYDSKYQKATILNLSHGFAIPVKHDELLKIVHPSPCKGGGTL